MTTDLLDSWHWFNVIYEGAIKKTAFSAGNNSADVCNESNDTSHGGVDAAAVHDVEI